MKEELEQLERRVKELERQVSCLPFVNPEAMQKRVESLEKRLSGSIFYPEEGQPGLAELLDAAAPLAQTVEHALRKAEVGGAIPPGGSKFL